MGEHRVCHLLLVYQGLPRCMAEGAGLVARQMILVLPAGEAKVPSENDSLTETMSTPNLCKSSVSFRLECGG